MALLSTVAIFLSISSYLVNVFAFDNSHYNNVADRYWGQNSYGATSSNTANYQQPISFYCQDDAIDVLPVAFVNTFFGMGGVPVLNLANTCNPMYNATFPGTDLINCSALAADIQYCQSKGKIVTISLGVAGGGVGFTSDAQAQTFAHTIWNLFLGGSSSPRPFGNAVLDGVDLDIEGGGSTSYAAFVTKIRSLASGASKQYYITGAPQCPFPDAYLGSVIDQVGFDAIYVQFYNNQCSLKNYDVVSDWNFGVWHVGIDKPEPERVKIYVGAPGSSTAAGSGYVPIEDLGNIAVKMRTSFRSFGGVMLWDASQAYANNRYDLANKHVLSGAGPTGFTYPPCSAPAYALGTAYTQGETASYKGYIWEAAYWTNAVPNTGSSSGWSPISACSGPSTQPASTTTSSTASTAPTTGGTTSPSTGAATCSGVAAWQSGVVYTAGNKATYGGYLWTANWWTENDAPGGSTGDWTKGGTCYGTFNGVI